MPTIDIDEYLGPMEPGELEALNSRITAMLENSAPFVNNPPPVNSMERQVVFSLASQINGDTISIPTHHTGKWFDWRYDEFEMTRPMLQGMVNNFKSRTLHPQAPLDRQIPLQAGHGMLSEPPALSWATKLEVKKEADSYVLWATFPVDEQLKTDLQTGKYAFVSPQYEENYIEQRIVDGKRKEHGPLLIHVALTNSPVLAELPNLALSKNAMSFDIVRNQVVEATMVQETQVPPASEAQVQDPPADPPADPPTTLPVSDPPAQPPAQQSLTRPPAEEPQSTTSLSIEESVALRRDMDNMRRQLAEADARNHSLTVETVISEAVSRGVPPAVTAIIRPILLSVSPNAEASISLSTVGGGSARVNTYQALERLLTEMPTIDFRQLTVESNTPGAPDAKMTTEEAEAEGRKAWTKFGIVPGTVRNEE